MFIGLVSLLTNRPVRNDRPMTGEVSLHGLVLPVGGIKEKGLAALRAGINTVLLPARNQKALDDIPQEARPRLEFVWLETVATQCAPRWFNSEAGRDRRIEKAPGYAIEKLSKDRTG